MYGETFRATTRHNHKSSDMTGYLVFQLHFQNCISKISFMKSVDEKIIFINISTIFVRIKQLISYN